MTLQDLLTRKQALETAIQSMTLELKGIPPVCCGTCEEWDQGRKICLKWDQRPPESVEEKGCDDWWQLPF